MQNGTVTLPKLAQFQFDPREPIYRARCPFCGLDIMMGVRKDNGHSAIAHSSHADKDDVTRTRHVTSCEGFKFLLTQADVLPRLHKLGARWERVEEFR